MNAIHEDVTIHADVKFTRAMTKGLRDELEDLASWLELGGVTLA